MKKILLLIPLISICQFAFSEDYYRVSNATDTESSAPYIQSSPYRLLWCANGTNGTLQRGLKDYYVKVAGNSTVSILGILPSGSGGQFNNMVTLLEDSSVLELTSTNAIQLNSVSNAGLIYKFNLAEGASSATIKTTDANATFNLSYSGNGADTIDRGIMLGQGVNLVTESNLSISNTATQYPLAILQLDGNVSVAAGSSLYVSGANLTQSASSTIKADSIYISNSDVNIGGAISSQTSGGNLTVYLNGGEVNLSAQSADVFANAYLRSEETDASSQLNVKTSLTFNKLKIMNTASSLTVDEGITLTVGSTSSTVNFENYGSGTIKGTLIINSSDAQHNPSSKLGLLTVDGGTIIENSAQGSYALDAYNRTVKLINGATAKVTRSSGFLGISENGTYDVDATSIIDASNIAFSERGGTLVLASPDNLAQKSGILVNGPSTMLLSTAQLYLTADTGNYDFGKLMFLRNSNIKIYLGEAKLSFSGVESYQGRECNSEIILYDFAPNMVSLGIDESMLSANGIITTGITSANIKLTAYDVNGELLTGDWSITADGYLANSGLIPEPAEWALLLGISALALAAYRRRK